MTCRHYLLTPDDIPKFWESIKSAATSADLVKPINRIDYLNELLNALYNQKAQCFVRLDENKRLLAIWITRIVLDKISGNCSLFIQSVYSWKVVNQEEWFSLYDMMKTFAIKKDCSRIYFESSNNRLHELATTTGFKEIFRNYSKGLKE